MIWRLVSPAVTSRRPFTSDKWPRVALYIAEHQGAMASAHTIIARREARHGNRWLRHHNEADRWKFCHRGMVEGILECNQMPNSTGQAPEKTNALPRISAGHHWASLGITWGHWALRSSLRPHGDFCLGLIAHGKKGQSRQKCAVSRDTSTGNSARESTPRRYLIIYDSWLDKGM